MSVSSSVGVAVKPTCVTKRAVAALNQNFRPRRIIVVTTSDQACRKFRTFASNIECLLETELLPDVSKETVREFLHAHYGHEKHVFSGREDAGWYLQQFLKLGAVLYVKRLSPYFIVWDLDMILLKPIEIFRESDIGRRTIVNIGGANSVGYDYSYKNLTGREITKAPDGTSFVTHSMIVYQPYMKELLEFLSDRPRFEGSPKGSPWVWAILSALHPQELHVGFSEYATYASWVLQKHPESVYVMPNKTWSRHPLGGQKALSLTKVFNRDGLCCPSDMLIASMKKLGYQYTGFEIGHHPGCRYNDPRHRHGYGV